MIKLYEPKIRVTYSYGNTIVGGARRHFSTLNGARKWAQARVGAHPVLTDRAAVGKGGVIKVQGVEIAELFPAEET